MDFDLLPDSNSQTDINSALNKLSTLVTAGSPITINGVTYNLVQGSMEVTVTQKPTTTPSQSTTAPTAKSGKSYCNTSIEFSHLHLSLCCMCKFRSICLL